MSDDAEEECPECPAGIPAWVMTFADLMSLLMCFFVLLLSFSEMDALKYKQLAGSMNEAFGVQNEIEVKDIPKGTSVIAQEFSPGRPDPTPINEVRQFTAEITRESLDVMCEEEGNKAEKSTEGGEAQQTAVVIEKLQEMISKTEDDALEMAAALQHQISDGQIEVETRGRKIVIRIKEKGSFVSGSADLQAAYLPIMATIKDVLLDTEGTISVEGHTDSIPIETYQFRSNWDLSTRRASSVAHELMYGGVIHPNRFKVTGYAETHPLVPNDTPENRARNRRVEIIVKQGVSKALRQEMDAVKGEDPDLYKLFNEQDSNFDLAPDEVF